VEEGKRKEAKITIMRGAPYGPCLNLLAVKNTVSGFYLTQQGERYWKNTGGETAEVHARAGSQKIEKDTKGSLTQTLIRDRSCCGTAQGGARKRNERTKGGRPSRGGKVRMSRQSTMLENELTCYGPEKGRDSLGGTGARVETPKCGLKNRSGDREPDNLRFM